MECDENINAFTCNLLFMWDTEAVHHLMEAGHSVVKLPGEKEDFIFVFLRKSNASYNAENPLELSLACRRCFCMPQETTVYSLSNTLSAVIHSYRTIIYPKTCYDYLKTEVLFELIRLLPRISSTPWKSNRHYVVGLNLRGSGATTPQHMHATLIPISGSNLLFNLIAELKKHTYCQINIYNKKFLISAFNSHCFGLEIKGPWALDQSSVTILADTLNTIVKQSKFSISYNLILSSHDLEVIYVIFRNATYECPFSDINVKKIVERKQKNGVDGNHALANWKFGWLEVLGLIACPNEELLTSKFDYTFWKFVLSICTIPRQYQQNLNLHFLYGFGCQLYKLVIQSNPLDIEVSSKKNFADNFLCAYDADYLQAEIINLFQKNLSGTEETRTSFKLHKLKRWLHDTHLNAIALTTLSDIEVENFLCLCSDERHIVVRVICIESKLMKKGQFTLFINEPTINDILDPNSNIPLQIAVSSIGTKKFGILVDECINILENTENIFSLLHCLELLKTTIFLNFPQQTSHAEEKQGRDIDIKDSFIFLRLKEGFTQLFLEFNAEIAHDILEKLQSIREKVLLNFLEKKCSGLYAYEAKHACHIQYHSILLSAPVRLDLSSRCASDLPVYTYMHGGAAINLAVMISNQRPIVVDISHIDERYIILQSDDLEISETLANLDELYNFKSQLRLHKAALIISSLISDKKLTLAENLDLIGGGVRLRTRVSLPFGTGLGVSGILIASMLKAIYKFTGQCVDERILFQQAMYGEYLINSPCGWQDAIGGLRPGLKAIVCASGAFEYIIEEIDLPEAFEQELYNRAVLLYIPRDYCRGVNISSALDLYLAKDQNYQFAVTQCQHTHNEIKESIQKFDIDRLAFALKAYHGHMVHFDKYYTTPLIDNMLDSLKDLINGYKISGAGQGGYLILIAKPGNSLLLHERLEKMVARWHEMGIQARINTLQIDKVGITIERVIQKKECVRYDRSGDSKSSKQLQIFGIFNNRKAVIIGCGIAAVACGVIALHRQQARP